MTLTHEYEVTVRRPDGLSLFVNGLYEWRLVTFGDSRSPWPGGLFSVENP